MNRSFAFAVVSTLLAAQSVAFAEDGGSYVMKLSPPRSRWYKGQQ